MTWNFVLNNIYLSCTKIYKKLLKECNMKYFIKTFGCQMNVHESEKLAGMLESLGYSVTDNQNDADVIVFNTCCIRDGVEQKIMGNIGALKKLKKAKPNLCIAICGCMSQAEGRDKLISFKTCNSLDFPLL